jgi:3-deoxy-D-manno-octulosonate 8-phosphate phosphatase (KDO 8-P phosphatase)
MSEDGAHRLAARLSRVRLLVLDVDGTLTDGGLIHLGDGTVAKRFDVRDGLAIRLLQRAGVAVAVLTGRSDPAVDRRLDELQIPAELRGFGSKDKRQDLERLRQAAGVEPDEVAAMGDDLPDLPMLTAAGIAACPADAAGEVRHCCHLVCRSDGGRGAVRELAERLLSSRGSWERIVDGYVSDETRKPSR